VKTVIKEQSIVTLEDSDEEGLRQSMKDDEQVLMETLQLRKPATSKRAHQ